MGLYIYRLVIDANVINARGVISEMNELENYFKLGIVEIVQTSVLPVELANYKPGKEKAEGYATIEGGNFFGHSNPKIGIWQGRKSNLEIIYTTLWGKMWKKGGDAQNKIDPNSLRDALHLDACWINQADIFITNDGAGDKLGILQKRDDLYAKGFDTKIYTPAECLAFLKEDFSRDFGTDDVTAILNRLQDTHKILLGSNGCKVAAIKSLETGETLFHTHWLDCQLHIEANFYDQLGRLLAKLVPNKEPQILEDDVCLCIDSDEPKIAYTIDSIGLEPKVEKFLRIGGIPASRLLLTSKSDIIFSGRIVPSGHVLFEGKFFNSQGKLVATIGKKLLNYEGISFKSSTGNVLPSI